MNISKYLKSQRPSLFLMRHCHIEKNEEKRYIGHTDYELSAEGWQQAKVWRHLLAGISFKQIITSDLKRAQDTAKIIVPNAISKVRLMPGLCEINLGDWENLSFKQVRETWPQKFEKRGQDLANFRPPGGESFADLQRRVLAGLIPVMERMQEHVLAIAHAGVNRVLICHILGMPLGKLFSLEQDYGGLNIIACGSKSYRLKVLNLQVNT